MPGIAELTDLHQRRCPGRPVHPLASCGGSCRAGGAAGMAAAAAASSAATSAAGCSCMGRCRQTHTPPAPCSTNNDGRAATAAADVRQLCGLGECKTHVSAWSVAQTMAEFKQTPRFPVTIADGRAYVLGVGRTYSPAATWVALSSQASLGCKT